MLAKRNRISKKEFSEVFSSGRSFHTPSLLMKIASAGRPHTFAFVIPAKVVPKASRRNYLRRIGYEAIQSTLSHFPGSAIFILKKGKISPSKAVFMKEIGETFEKIAPQALK